MTDEVIEVNEYLKIEWMYDRRVVVYTVTSLKREVIDEWSAQVIAAMNGWQSGQVYYSLHDFTGIVSFMTTPHLRQKSRENIIARPDLPARTAVCIPSSVTAHIIRLFLRALPIPKRTDRLRELFLSREEGMVWLLEEMKNTAHP